jgi:hypothetical protein
VSCGQIGDYIARVELHSASYTDYENLHSYMEKKGYSRQIVAGNGKTYKLPTGTYVARSVSETLDMALNAAVVAATQTGKKSAVIVADWTARNGKDSNKGVIPDETKIIVLSAHPW